MRNRGNSMLFRRPLVLQNAFRETSILEINSASNGFSRVQAVTVTSKHLLTEPAKQKTLAVYEQMSATDGSMERLIGGTDGSTAESNMSCSESEPPPMQKLMTMIDDDCTL